MRLLAATLPFRLLAVPDAASAAAVTAKIRHHDGLDVGPVTFTAAKGEANRLIVHQRRAFIVFRDHATP